MKRLDEPSAATTYKADRFPIRDLRIIARKVVYAETNRPYVSQFSDPLNRATRE